MKFMTQEEKDLLFKELSSRLAYRVKFPIYWWNEDTQTDEEIVATLYSINTDGYCEIFDHDGTVYIDNIKPYLRPMNSMTEEEQKEYHKTFRVEADTHGFTYIESFESFDWLTAHHFDYRGLIEKGIALEAPKDMY